MKEWITFFAQNAVEIINAMALLVLFVGTLEMG
jgi:hypothetical protein